MKVHLKNLSLEISFRYCHQPLIIKCFTILQQNAPDSLDRQQGDKNDSSH